MILAAAILGMVAAQDTGGGGYGELRKEDVFTF
jgi:hypothetical protein